MSRHLTAADRTQIIAGLRDGHSTRTIADQAGVHASTVSRVAKAAGIALDGSATRTATDARAEQVRARWAEEAHAALDAAEQIRASLLAPGDLHAWHQGEHRTQRVDRLPAAEQKSLAIAYGVMIDKTLAMRFHADLEDRIAELEQQVDRIDREDQP